MYEVDDRDRVIPLPEAPQSDIGAPMPVLVADEGRLELAYAAWDRGRDAYSVAVATFVGPYAHMFGPPNDEALLGHPLASCGLESYGAYRIEDSSWIRRLERMNSVHPKHTSESFLAMTHFDFAFHDSTFECVADAVEFALRPTRTVELSVRVVT